MAARRQGKLIGVLSKFYRVPCSLKAFFIKGGPIGNTSVEEADVDVVKVVKRVDPFAAAVVNLEVEIFGRSCFTESWGEVGA